MDALEMSLLGIGILLGESGTGLPILPLSSTGVTLPGVGILVGLLTIGGAFGFFGFGVGVEGLFLVGLELYSV